MVGTWLLKLLCGCVISAVHTVGEVVVAAVAGEVIVVGAMMVLKR